MWGCLARACFVGGTVRQPLEACLSLAGVTVTAVRGMAERGLGTRFSTVKELPLLSVSRLSPVRPSLYPHLQIALGSCQGFWCLPWCQIQWQYSIRSLGCSWSPCSLVTGLPQLQDTALAGFLLLLQRCSSALWPRALVVLGLVFGALAFLFMLPPFVVSSCITEFQTPSICCWSKVMSQAPDLSIWLLFRVSIGMSKTCLKHTWLK